MLTDEVKNQLKDKTKEQILEGVKKSEIVIPKEDRAEFFAFINKPVEERYPAESTDSQVPASATDDAAASQGGDAGQLPPVKEDWEELGYKSRGEMLEAHKNLLKSSASLQATIDGLNSKEGKRGQELKQLREQKDQLESELLKFKKTTSQPVVKPEKPKRPVASEFEDGVFDEKYIKARDEYEANYELYIEKLNEFNSFKSEERINSVVETVKKTVIETPAQPSNDGFAKLFNDDIPKFQEEFGLQTTVSIKSISDAYTNSASKDPIVAARAKTFINNCPPADLQRYEQVKNAVEIAYDFSSGNPVSRYRTGIKGALYDNGMLGEGSQYKPVLKQAALTPEEERAAIELQQKKNESGVSAIPASKIAGSDSMPSQAVTLEEEKKRYLDLSMLYNKALQQRGGKEAFEKTPEFEEYIRLRTKVTGKVPYWKR